MDPEDEYAGCCFDGWASANSRRARSKETVAGVTTSLLAALERRGLEGRTVIDIGCGVGDLMLALLARGASTGTGMDLGAEGIRRARDLAASRGLADRATFVVGDGAVAPLAGADLVVLNRVVCCYADVDALIENATGAAQRMLAFTAPVDRGIAGAFNRVSTWCSNRWYALRKEKYRGFRVFVHDLDAVERKIRSAGFERTHDDRVRGVWRLEIFARPQGGHAGGSPRSSNAAHA
jgi:magnesium-protoporphyrin O-methyltransferase